MEAHTSDLYPDLEFKLGQIVLDNGNCKGWKATALFWRDAGLPADDPVTGEYWVEYDTDDAYSVRDHRNFNDIRSYLNYRNEMGLIKGGI